MTPEQKSRQQIDRQLEQAGWIVQEYRQMNIYGQGRPPLGFDGLRMTPVVLPPQNEQDQVVAVVEQRVSIIDAALEQIEHGLLRASRLCQSMLEKAFEGKLVPQDPNDEPASVLLERLRANRSAHKGNGKAATPAPNAWSPGEVSSSGERGSW